MHDGERGIGDYAAIGNCRTAALVSKAGSLDWLCLPHFSGPAIFGALLDRRRGGYFALRPVNAFDANRCYQGASNVLETTYTTDTGRVRVTDCCSLADAAEGAGQLQPQHEVLRVMEGLEGRVPVEVLFEPRPDFGRTAFRFRARGALGWECDIGSGEVLFLHSDLPLHPDSGPEKRLTGRIDVEAGQRFHLSLTYERHGIGVVLPLGPAAEQRLVATRQWWQRWSEQCRYDGPYRDAVLRSALVLKLCTFHLSGAVVAAPTTSLPEAVGGVRNWDYRYCWLRDAALTFRAFHDLGFHAEGAAFLEWLLHATALTQPELQVVYDVYGRTDLPEQELDHLDGYRGSRPVRIGNGAGKQLQLDVYGSVVLAAHAFVERGGQLTWREARFVVGLGRHICRHWQQPDQSIWEIRGPGRRYTYSAFMSWLALDCLLTLDAEGKLRVPRARFQRERDAIRAAIESRAFNSELGAYVDALDGKELDASLLLMGCYGYHAADHPRLLATFERIRRDLGVNGLLRRYRPGYDGLPPGEGAFGLCSFWAVDNLARQGRRAEAEQLFEHLLTFGNDLGLFAEEIDVASGEPLGNFPQAFTHIGLINAAVALQSTACAERAAC